MKGWMRSYLQDVDCFFHQTGTCQWARPTDALLSPFTACSSLLSLLAWRSSTRLWDILPASVPCTNFRPSTRNILAFSIVMSSAVPGFYREIFSLLIHRMSGYSFQVVSRMLEFWYMRD